MPKRGVLMRVLAGLVSIGVGVGLVVLAFATKGRFSEIVLATTGACCVGIGLVVGINDLVQKWRKRKSKIVQ